MLDNLTDQFDPMIRFAKIIWVTISDSDVALHAGSPGFEAQWGTNFLLDYYKQLALILSWGSQHIKAYLESLCCLQIFSLKHQISGVKMTK